MENKKGNGIFLGVVSVATLVVAIIGATFAYFSASVSSDNNAVQAGAYEFSASLNLRELYTEGSQDLIPLEAAKEISGAQAPNNTNLTYALNVGNKDEARCIDDQGFRVCHVYEVTIENNGAQPITLAGVIRTVSNTASSTVADATAFKNLSYYVLGGSENAFTLGTTTGKLAENVDGTASLGTVTVNGATTSTDPETQATTTTAGSATVYVVVYLDEPLDGGTTQDQSSEMGAKYVGQFVFTSTSGNGNRLTGTFNVGA